MVEKRLDSILEQPFYDWSVAMMFDTSKGVRRHGDLKGAGLLLRKRVSARPSQYLHKSAGDDSHYDPLHGEDLVDFFPWKEHVIRSFDCGNVYMSLLCLPTDYLILRLGNDRLRRVYLSVGLLFLWPPRLIERSGIPAARLQVNTTYNCCGATCSGKMMSKQR